jgi:hypothetical protein
MAALLEAMESWATDTPLVQRAAAAALCESRLLRDRRSEAFQALRKGLGARKAESRKLRSERSGISALRFQLSAFPRAGCAATTPTSAGSRENLKKARLARVDAAWVQAWQHYLRGERSAENDPSPRPM